MEQGPEQDLSGLVQVSLGQPLPSLGLSFLAYTVLREGIAAWSPVEELSQLPPQNADFLFSHLGRLEG